MEKEYQILKEHIDTRTEIILKELEKSNTKNLELEKRISNLEKKYLIIFVAVSLLVNKVQIPQKLVEVLLNVGNIN